MSQRGRAEQILNKLRLPNDDERNQLKTIVAEAQNALEYGGEADGTINPQAWDALRDVVGAFNTLKDKIETFKRSLS